MNDETLDSRYAGRYGESLYPRPFLTTAIGAVVVAGLATLGEPSGIMQAGTMLLFSAFNGGLLAVVVWLVCLAIAIRRASGAWKTGSFVLFFVIGMAVEYGQYRQFDQVARAKATKIAVDRQKAIDDAANAEFFKKFENAPQAPSFPANSVVPPTRRYKR